MSEMKASVLWRQDFIGYVEELYIFLNKIYKTCESAVGYELLC